MVEIAHWLRRNLLVVLVLATLALVLLVAAPWERWRPAAPAATPNEQGETMIGRVARVLEEGSIEVDEGLTQPYQRLLLRVERGSLAGQEVMVEEGGLFATGQDRLFRPGDPVYLERVPSPGGDRFFISDPVRTWPLLFLAGLFMVLLLAVGRGKGLRSLAGTVSSLTVIFAFVIPQILAGRDPLLVSIAGAVGLLAVFNYLVYGWNPKAHAAMGGMTLSLLLTGILAWCFVGLTRLSGLGAEESTYLLVSLGPEVQLRKLLLGGVIIGSLGVLDDICVGQASAVFELVKANPGLSWRALFRHSLNIGRDHIAATVNTLLLAYMGASLPLMLLLYIYQEPILRRLSREPITEEIVRTLVGSMGLILAVPITGLLASLLASAMVRRRNAARLEPA